MAPLNINDILSQAKQLDKEDQLTLLQRLSSLLRRTQTTKTTSSARLTSLAGLGSEIWKSADAIDSYIDGERQW